MTHFAATNAANLSERNPPMAKAIKVTIEIVDATEAETDDRVVSTPGIQMMLGRQSSDEEGIQAVSAICSKALREQIRN